MMNETSLGPVATVVSAVKGHHNKSNNNTIHQARFAGSAGPMCGRSHDCDPAAQTRDREPAHGVAKGLGCVGIWLR